MTEAILPPSPERLQHMTGMEGLHGRLVLKNQEALSLSKDCKTSDLKTSSFEERDYTPFENASRFDRQTYWTEKSESNEFENDYNEWKTKLVESFSGEKGKKMQKGLSPLLDKTGVTHAEGEEFSKDDAEKVYNRYLISTDDSGVKRFVKDILSSYSIANTDTMMHDLPKIQWLAHIFGEKAQEMVTHLILAEAKVRKNPQFVENLPTIKNTMTNETSMRINILDDEEKRILDFISNSQTPIPLRTNIPRKNIESEEELSKELPILQYKKDIQELVTNNDSVIIIGGTGSGKTTQVPQMIREIMKEEDKLIVTEPRQINTENLAKRVAEESGVTLGVEIGYKHGDKETTPNPKTDTIFNTEGILLNKLLHDPLLSGISHVMIDEVHVRSTDTEQLLAYLKKAQKLRKEQGLPPLKIIVASATVNKDELVDYFDNAPVLDVEGRMYPISLHFENNDLSNEEKPNRAADIVHQISDHGFQGSGLIAVAGVRDIKEHARVVREKNPDAIIIELHRGSSDKEKAEVEKEAEAGKHRVIIATDFVQTGITIPDLTYVINTGDVNKNIIDERTDLVYLSSAQQSQAEIDQWSGRAGRVKRGDVYNLFTETNYISRHPYPIPEVKRSDLTELILNTKKMGYNDVSEVQFLSELDDPRIALATDILQKLGALNPDGSLNEVGIRMLEFKTDYHLARMIVAGEEKGKGVKELCMIAAMADNNRNLFKRDTEKETRARFKHPTSDFLMYLNMWNEFEKNGQSPEWAKANGLDHTTLMSIKTKANKLYRIAKRTNDAPTEEDLEHSIFLGYRDKLMKHQHTRGNYIWPLKRVVNFNIYIDSSSTTASIMPEYIVAAKNGSIRMKKNGGRFIHVSECQRVKPEWL